MPSVKKSTLATVGLQRIMTATRPQTVPFLALPALPHDDRLCEGFRMTADRDDAACTGAVVRKPPMKDAWGTCGGAAGFDLSGLDACCCRDLPAQLLRYGTNVANGGKT